jgi:hypothetical protein
MARKVDEGANFVFVRLIDKSVVYMTNATKTMLGGQNRFGLEKNFSRDGVSIQVVL